MYKEIFEIWTKEKASEYLRGLPDDFYDRIQEYVFNLEKVLDEVSQDTLGWELVKKELENVQFMLKDLFDVRMMKIFNILQTRSEVNLDKLTITEEEMHKSIADSISKCLDQLLIFKGEQIRKDVKDEPKYLIVRLLRPIPAIVGADLRTYGPFEIDDVAVLPSNNAKVLVNRGVASRITQNRVEQS
ncbi:MAG: hypothetical protein ACFFA1_04060 [Promethearchaeota archaeon]